MHTTFPGRGADTIDDLLTGSSETAVEPSQPPPPPTKVCRRCSVASATTAETCPSCGTPYARWRPSRRALLVGAGITLAVAGIVAVTLAVTGGDDERQEGFITNRQARSAQLGISRTQLEEAFGQPVSVVPVENSPERVCLIYDAENVSTQWRFCFDGFGTLQSVSTRSRPRPAAP